MKMLKLLEYVMIIASIVGKWKVYEKMDMPGWYSLIPFYNIYICVKTYIKWSKGFSQEAGIVLGLIFIPSITLCILGFGSYEFSREQALAA